LAKGLSEDNKEYVNFSGMFNDLFFEEELSYIFFGISVNKPGNFTFSGKKNQD